MSERVCAHIVWLYEKDIFAVNILSKLYRLHSYINIVIISHEFGNMRISQVI